MQDQTSIVAEAKSMVQGDGPPLLLTGQTTCTTSVLAFLVHPAKKAADIPD